MTAGVVGGAGRGKGVGNGVGAVTNRGGGGVPPYVTVTCFPDSYQEVVGSLGGALSRVVLAANNLPTSLSARPALTSSPAEGGLAAAPVAGAGPWPYLLRTQPPPSVPSRSITARTPVEAVLGVAGGLWRGVVLLGLVRCQVRPYP